MKQHSIVTSVTLIAFLAIGALGADKYDYKILEEVIEISPYKNIPQNKNLQNTLKNKQSPLNIKRIFNSQDFINANKDNNQSKSSNKNFTQNNTVDKLDEKGLVLPKAEEFHFKYNFFIETKENGKVLTLKDLGINEQWLNESIIVLKKSDLDISALQEIVNIVSYYFQYNGYPSATAYIPQQEITDTIQINIAIGKLGEYQVKNYSHLEDWAIDSKLKNSLKGKILKTKELEDAIYKINEMYGIKATGTLTPGSERGDTDIVIEVEDSKKASAMLFFDNYGNKSSGVYHVGASGSINNLTGFGDSINFFAQISDELQKNYGITYNTFLGNLKISPKINRSNYELGGNYVALGAYGGSVDFGVDLSYPISINTTNSLYVTGGYTHRKLQDVYENFKINFNKHSDIGYAGIEGTLSFIPYNVFSYNARLTYGKVIPDSKFLGKNPMGDFWKLNAYLNNSYSFHENFTHIININYQQTIGGYELDSSETASLGGPYGIRAYSNGFGEADSMFLTSFGIRTNILHPNFYITPFYEFAYGWNENYQNNHIAGINKNTLFVDAVGLELLYMKADLFYAKLDLAKAFNKYKNKREDKVYVSFGIYF